MSQLFRQEVLDFKKTKNLGTVFINIPFNVYVLSFGMAVILSLMILFLCFAEYSEKYMVNGYLDYSKGFIPIYSGKSGLIVKGQMKNHQHVNQGDVLFKIDTSYSDAPSQNKILSRLNHQTRRLGQDIVRIKKELVVLKPLLAKKYISADVYNTKKDHLNELRNKKNQLEIERIQHQKRNAYLVQAPINGRLTVIHYQVGQQISPSDELVKIIPDNTDLLAEIQVPVKHAGFMSRNDPITLRYDAYPYERFGTYTAIIKDIDPVISVDKTAPHSEPYYRVRAKLGRQFVTVYGRQKGLQQGMTFSAVMTGTRRKVWQWIWEPINHFMGS
ncbi:HlyD family efflux transporter periplasmic adaptor subunit [Legionella sp. MW5194]|uniref:HlyD family secretion protein n=1 Tax=Legionella sp. MW5194 TaxID=2662448 RepID=UPI00193D0557|nr:HlyD family efflux transporter periplasmic adaptor subunit [Legionella sp. MW5194]QRN02595.1 HlyD family efflux transporter periplasmic adaptor subunit [Legionella sp. MW5194]